MARDVNALINKCENAITQEEKTISDAKPMKKNKA